MQHLLGILKVKEIVPRKLHHSDTDLAPEPIHQQGPFFEPAFPKERILHSRQRAPQPKPDWFTQNGSLQSLSCSVTSFDNDIPGMLLYEPVVMQRIVSRHSTKKPQAVDPMSQLNAKPMLEYPGYRFAKVNRFFNTFHEPRLKDDVVGIGPMPPICTSLPPLPIHTSSNFLLPIQKGIKGRGQRPTHEDAVRAIIEKATPQVNVAPAVIQHKIEYPVFI